MPQAPQRNTLVFVAAILCIVFGGLGVILSLVAFAGISVLVGLGASGGFLWILGIISLGVAGFELYVGIIGVQNASNPAKSDTLFKFGIILLGISLLSMILGIVSAVIYGGSVFSGILGFVIPALYTVGAYNMKNQPH